MLSIKEVNQKGRYLTLATARALIGKKIIATSPQYRMNIPIVMEYTVTSIVTEWEWAAGQPYPNGQYKNFQEYWESFMTKQRKDKARHFMILIDENGIKRGSCYTQPFSEEEDPILWGSDEGRFITFVLSEENKEPAEQQDDFSFPNYVVQVIKTTDWGAFQKQKESLLKCMNQTTEDNLDGLLNFIDAIQDAIVMDELAKESEMFPEVTE